MRSISVMRSTSEVMHLIPIKKIECNFLLFPNEDI